VVDNEYFLVERNSFDPTQDFTYRPVFVVDGHDNGEFHRLQATTGLLVAREPKRANAFVQVRAFDTEDARRSGDVPVSGFQRLEDTIALGGITGVLQGCRNPRVGLKLNFEWNRSGQYVITRRQYRHAFNRIAKLARVAGPAVLLKQGNNVVI